MKNVIAAEVQYTSPLKVNQTYYPISIKTGSTSFSIVNPGTAAAPCRLSFVPVNDLLSITIEGLSDEPLVLKKIYAGDRVVIDGINKTYTVNNTESFENFDGWEFPKIQPGQNIVTMTAADEMVVIELEFQPRYI